MTIVIADAEKNALATLNLADLEQNVSSLLHESVLALFPNGEVNIQAIWNDLAALRTRVGNALANAVRGVTPPAEPHPFSIKEAVIEDFQKVEQKLVTWVQHFTRNNEAWVKWSEEALPAVLSLPQVQDLASRALKGLDDTMATLLGVLKDHPGTPLTVSQPDAPKPVDVPEPGPDPIPAATPVEPAQSAAE